MRRRSSIAGCTEEKRSGAQPWGQSRKRQRCALFPTCSDAHR
jgi:hypothetical protein